MKLTQKQLRLIIVSEVKKQEPFCQGVSWDLMRNALRKATRHRLEDGEFTDKIYEEIADMIDDPDFFVPSHPGDIPSISEKIAASVADGLRDVMKSVLAEIVDSIFRDAQHQLDRGEGKWPKK
jgi:hypothetical protein